MKITKHEHAHLVVEVDDRKLIIDPGSFSVDAAAEGVEAVVITHAHGDHWTADNLRSIRAANPDVVVLGPQAVADAVGEGVRVVAPGDRLTVGGFQLTFTGGEHEPIHSELVKTGTNVGVVVDDTLYHPGDSFTLPPAGIPVLALPIAGPWHSVEKAIDMVRATEAAKVFNLHDAVLSGPGVAMTGAIVSRFVAASGGEYSTLAPGESLQV